MTKVTRPMLAAKFKERHVTKHITDIGRIVVQPKIDGMRALISSEMIPLTRSGKEHKNVHIRRWVQDHPSLAFLDGEFSSGHEYTPEAFRDSMSGIRASQGSESFTFFAFDCFHPEFIDSPYDARRTYIRKIVAQLGQYQEHHGYHARLILCPQLECASLGEVYAEEARLIAEGWEGAILRRPDMGYKFGRSTGLQGNLIKLKQFEDAEAEVIGYTPWYENQNEATQSPLGYTERSAHQENKKALDRIGAWKVRLLTDPSVEFEVGVMLGITHSDRDRMWEHRDSYIGKVMTFKHQGYGGGYDVPRTPVFLKWRDVIEL